MVVGNRRTVQKQCFTLQYDIKNTQWLNKLKFKKPTKSLRQNVFQKNINNFGFSIKTNVVYLAVWRARCSETWKFTSFYARKELRCTTLERV